MSPVTLALAALLTLPAHAPPVREEAGDTVATARARIQTLLDEGRPRMALGHLRRLLARPDVRDAARAAAAPLAELALRARFLVAYDPPDLEDLVHGKATLDRRTGRVRLDLHAGFLASWPTSTALPDDPGARAEEALLAGTADLPSRPLSGRRTGTHELVDWIVIPLRFSGRHHVRVEGEAPPADRCVLQPRVAHGLGGPAPLEVTFAFLDARWRWREGVVRGPPGPRGLPLSDRQPGAADFKLMYGEAYEVRSEVFGSGLLRSSLNGRPHLSAEVGQGSEGFLAVAACHGVRRVRIEGQLDLAWYDGIQQTLADRSLEVFRRDHDPAEVLPPWLVAALPGEEP